MTTQAATSEQTDESIDDETETPDEAETEAQAEAEATDDAPGEDEGEGDEKKPEPKKDDEDGPLTVTIGEEEAPPPPEKAAHAWREKRRREKELEQEVRELRAKVATTASTPSQVPTLGKKPTAASYDFDDEKYEAALLKWHDDKRKVDEHQARVQQEQQEAQRRAQETAARYATKAKELAAPDFADAEGAVVDAFDLTQQGILMGKAKDAATLVYALGKSPAKLKKLAAIKDPLDFVVALKDLERGMTVTTRKPPEPEETVRGSSTSSTKSDPHLERLERIADRTGDRTAIIKYKEQLREKQKKK
jgi:hypothetical protein